MKRHKWQASELGDWPPRDTCKVCGAKRSVWGREYSPAYLNDKRQPYCPGPQREGA